LTLHIHSCQKRNNRLDYYTILVGDGLKVSAVEAEVENVVNARAALRPGRAKAGNALLQTTLASVNAIGNVTSALTAKHIKLNLNGQNKTGNLHASFDGAGLRSNERDKSGKEEEESNGLHVVQRIYVMTTGHKCKNHQAGDWCL